MTELVKIISLNSYVDPRGRLMELLRMDNQDILSVGPIEQVYMATCYPQVVKAWHLHRVQTDRMVCVSGVTRFAFVQERLDRKSAESVVIDGKANPSLIIIPPGIWHGFQNLGESENLIINCPNKLYDYEKPDEVRMTPDGMAEYFDWYQRVDG